MEVLIQGREFVSQLQVLLLQNTNFLFGDGVFEESALELTAKIHQSFTEALFLFNTNSNDHATLTLSPVHTGISSFSNSDNWKSSCDSEGAPGSNADQKIGFKRRKISHTWVKVTPAPVDDGHAWRKYGQKVIHNNEFPRSYYRCTHRKEQGCEATKQVQKTQDKPSIYQTTYKGNHTCKERTSFLDAAAISDDFMLDESESACVINFQTHITTKQPTYTFSSTSVKKQDKLNKLNTEITQQEYYNPLENVAPVDSDLTLSEFFLLADLSAFDTISREVFEVLGVQPIC